MCRIHILMKFEYQSYLSVPHMQGGKKSFSNILIERDWILLIKII